MPNVTATTENSFFSSAKDWLCSSFSKNARFPPAPSPLSSSALDQEGSGSKPAGQRPQVTWPAARSLEDLFPGDGSLQPGEGVGVLGRQSSLAGEGCSKLLMQVLQQRESAFISTLYL